MYSICILSPCTFILMLANKKILFFPPALINVGNIKLYKISSIIRFIV